MDVTEKVNKIFSLYEKHGASNYLGERVSKTEHSIQCAMLAEKEECSNEVVLGAFLHDIGHLIGLDQGLEEMITDHVNLGTQDHCKVGGDYLHEMGFSDIVCKIVAGHVQAKRYLVYTDQDYYKNLSSASKKTLEHQGGPMTSEEALAFEKSPLFDIIVRMRTWDEKAKEPDIEMEPLEKYRKLCVDVLELQHNRFYMSGNNALV
ncbi:hypothetical protein CHS0354_028415 [Potamilus streckersoni]|uniref:HD domain-containing protein n=1 Tax=Potamilus streckersoni TaxID=2493646 RepID=A0AAE0SQL2_9BIVA|nr:hypothetical protein CHS0354_028415 [Potamilus streckersoni]